MTRQQTITVGNVIKYYDYARIETNTAIFADIYLLFGFLVKLRHSFTHICTFGRVATSCLLPLFTSGLVYLALSLSLSRTKILAVHSSRFAVSTKLVSRSLRFTFKI
jgi:hypothetical protein